MARDDDFILTLSDGEDDVSSVGEEGSDLEDFKSQQQVNGNKKRKRGDLDSVPSVNGGKKSKKQKKNKVNGVGLQDGDDEEEVVGKRDGAIDPEFEFEVTGGGKGGIVADGFDAWGGGAGDDDEVDNSKRGNKKAVDIEDIVERRRAKKEAKEKKIKEKKEKQNDDKFDGFGSNDETSPTDEEEDDDGQDEELQDMPDVDDDELLAADTFGAGADSDEEEENSEDEIESGEDQSQDRSDEEASDADSVASPVAHPDDVGSESDSDAESVDSAEEERRKAFFAPEEPASVSALNSASSSTAKTSFQSFSLSRPILKGISSVGFTAATPIQAKAIPVALLGKDVVGGAQTGSGKTGAFIIPILERLLYRPRKVPTSRVAILMPTRELAVQCFNVATKLASFTDITFCQLVGGFSLREQENILKKRPDVIIATPGRFIDHMRNSASFTVDTLEILVLDEADRMLEDGFADELNEILNTIPRSRQTMLFSATMTSSVDKLIRVGLNKPVRLMVDAKKSVVGTLVQEFVRLRPGREDKRLAVLMLLCTSVYTNRVIIFFRQKKEAHRVRVIFSLCGLKAAELHGSMSQEQRISAVESFRSGKASFLLATDLASRGLDIKGVQTVINHSAPQSHEIYMHRVGRTARAGASGRACTIAAEDDRKVVKQAVKTGRSQGAKIVSRVVDNKEVDSWAKKIDDLAEDIEEVLKEEKEEKQLASAEMQVTKADNMFKHEDEIMSRPKRTWFESEADKRASKQAGRAELNGVTIKGEKKKLSNKDKKRMDDRKDRLEGKMWRKGKGDAADAVKKGKNKGKDKGKDRPMKTGRSARGGRKGRSR
ncbi:putative atp-dependent rna helicase drs1 [Phaeomoniella chlamydospora]|uniref:RNA helicase n=1 Tax=Phaeomoniella chlamydospora TaxID=158046 RepID=A0A0G2F0Z6_PHACM|nr:putative atp-dependent rna helicase drs1 [Phaeomoniella chlamydospora]